LKKNKLNKEVAAVRHNKSVVGAVVFTKAASAMVATAAAAAAASKHRRLSAF
jgi:hypothetical protein